MANIPESQQAVLWHPSYGIRVETVATPKIQDADDAIVKITLAGLCGSDLHIYRGHEEFNESMICGHEFIGEVVALGANFSSQTQANRPALYSRLKVGDKIVSPFTVSCGKCHFCRVGFICRCPSGCLFGTPSTPGGQAQYVRVPKAGGTLYSVSGDDFWSTSSHSDVNDKLEIADSSLLLMCDILPTGVFAAFQILNHPKVLPMVTSLPYPQSSFREDIEDVAWADKLGSEDTILTIAVVGLGPVGLCACVSLLDMLATRKLAFRIVGVDLLQARREKAQAVYTAIDSSGKGNGEFVTASVDDSKEIVKKWTDGVGCNSVLEVVGHNSALTLAYDLVRSFGSITSVGVHGESQMPFTGRQLYAKNVSFDFGRCPVRAMFPTALDLLVRRQDVFGGVGENASLIDKIVGLEEAPKAYEEFDSGRVGKVLFDPWR